MSRFTDKRLFRKKNPERPVILPGQLGDGYGNLAVPGRPNFYYCRISGRSEVVYNDRVDAQNDLLVDVGRDTIMGAETPGIFKVLSTRSGAPAGASEIVQAEFAPASRYEIDEPGGGQDPVFSKLRQLMPLRVGAWSGMLVQLWYGIVPTTNGDIWIPFQTIDMEPYLPTTSGKSALVLITIDDTGAVAATRGNDFTTTAITTEDQFLAQIPADPPDTVYRCAAVRVYYGQTEITEVRVNSDIRDLRWAQDVAGAAAAAQANAEAYADSILNNFDIKLAVRAASQWNLAFSRSGNIYTATVLGVLLKATIDSGWASGASLAVGDRILLTSQTSPADNGIVTITDLGTIGTNAVLTRSTDADVSAEITSEMRVPVSEGTDANIDYKLSAPGPFVLNTTALPFTKAGGPPTGVAAGELSGTYPNPSLSNAAVIAKVLTGFSSGAGTVASTDSILSAFQKVVGNIALLAPLASPTFTGTPAAPTATAGTNSTQIATTAFVAAANAVMAGVSRVLAENLTLLDAQCLIVSEYVNLSTFDLTLQGDAVLQII